tara:strand:- start:1170 stop:1598 length:429 start_codon:yes stop_codon:yes gene_type:complete
MIALPNPTKILYTEHSSDNTMTVTFTDYVAQKDAQNLIQLNITKYSMMLCDALQQSHQRQHPNGRNYSYALISGRKYHKVMQCIDGQTESVHCFIDKKTGEVYKAASIKAPAKHVRFNLLLIRDREWLYEYADWAGGYLYMR